MAVEVFFLSRAPNLNTRIQASPDIVALSSRVSLLNYESIMYINSSGLERTRDNSNAGRIMNVGGLSCCLSIVAIPFLQSYPIASLNKLTTWKRFSSPRDAQSLDKEPNQADWFTPASRKPAMV